MLKKAIIAGMALLTLGGVGGGILAGIIIYVRS
jgi:hypothetical protein